MSIFLHTHTHTHFQEFTYPYVIFIIFTHLHSFTHYFTHIHICTFTFIRVFTFVPIHPLTHTWTFIFTHSFIYMHSHSFSHAFALPQPSLGALRGHRDVVTSLNWDAEFQLLSGSLDGTAMLWDINELRNVSTLVSSSLFLNPNSKCHILFEVEHELIIFKFKACTSFFASASSPVKTFGKSVTCIDYSVRSGLVLTGHSDFNVRLSDPRAEGQVIKSTRKSHKGLVSSVAWKPDSDVLFASSSYDKTVKIWDVRSEIPLFTIKGGSAKLFCACWSGMDGDVIATGGAQKVLKRFRIKN